MNDSLRKLSPRERQNHLEIWVTQLQADSPELWRIISEVLEQYASTSYLRKILTAALAPFYNNDQERFLAKIRREQAAILRQHISAHADLSVLITHLRNSGIKKKHQASRRLDIFSWKQFEQFFREDSENDETIRMRNVALCIYFIIFLAENLAEQPARLAN